LRYDDRRARRTLAPIFLLLLAGCTTPEAPAPPEQSPAPVVQEAYEPVDGLLRIGPEPDRAIPLTDKGHTLLLPPGTAPLAGLAVFLDGWRVSIDDQLVSPDTFERVALANNVGILRLTTGNPLDFYFEEDTLRDVAERLQTVLETGGLQETPLLFTGLSLGGTRALKLAIFLKENPTRFWAQPQAVAIVDAPLDMVRFWEAEQRAAADAFHPAAADEGRWVSYLLETHLGGPPREHFDAYVAYSPFVYTAPLGGNARYLRNVPIRAYHEPDVNWWIENRRKSYYSMNSIDLAALINALKLQGNTRAELVTTYQAREGFAEGASPHTWSFVDNAALIAWFLRQET